MNKSPRGIGVFGLVVIWLHVTCGVVAGFGPGLDQQKLAEQEKRVAGMRQEMGDDRFAAFAIAKLRHISTALPKQHPLYQRRVLTQDTPEHTWVVDEYMLLALLPELEATGSEQAIDVLRDLVALRQVQVEGAYFMSYGNHTFHRRARRAYFSLAMTHGDQPLKTIRDYLEQFGWEEDAVNAIAAGADRYGGWYPPEDLLSFLEWCADWSLRQSPAAGSQLAEVLGKGNIAGSVSLNRLLELAEQDDGFSERLLILLVLAHDPRLDEADHAEERDRWRDLVVGEWKRCLDDWETAPLADHHWQGMKLARLNQIVRERPDPRFKPLALRTARLVPQHSAGLIREVHEAHGLRDEEFESLHAALQSPTLIPAQQVALMRLLKELDYRPVAADVRAFINRYDLRGTKRDDDGESDALHYPALNLRSDDVDDWQQWLNASQPAP